MKYIISYSGGKDSTAALLWAYEQFEPSDIVVVFCDTGWETHITYDYVAYIEGWCKDHGIIFHRVVPPLQFEELVKHKKMFPFKMRRYCTEYLKIKPFYMFLAKYRETHPDYIVITGERAEESPSRANKPEREFDGQYYHCEVWRPLKNWTAEEVFKVQIKHSVNVNPMYHMGFTRVGCAPCIYAKVSDVEMLAKHFPEQIDKVRKLEACLESSKTVDRPMCFFEGTAKIDEKVAHCSRKTAHGCIEDFLPEDSVCPAHYAILCE